MALFENFFYAIIDSTEYDINYSESGNVQSGRHETKVVKIIIKKSLSQLLLFVNHNGNLRSVL